MNPHKEKQIRDLISMIQKDSSRDFFVFDLSFDEISEVKKYSDIKHVFYSKNMFNTGLYHCYLYISDMLKTNEDNNFLNSHDER